MPCPDFSVQKGSHVRPLQQPPPDQALRLPFDFPLPSVSSDLHKQGVTLGLDHSLVGMTGGQIVVEMLLRHNVKHIFSIPGGSITPILDTLYDCPEIDVILPRHEQGAGHMAEGYARSSGKPGIVLVTSGPGATNMITPLQDALCDGIPLVMICGQIPTTMIGTDSLQDTDVVGITKPCTKWNYSIRDVAEIPRRINEAFEIAMSGRAGPVLIELPKDIGNDVLRQPVSTQMMIPKMKKMALQNAGCIRHAPNPSSYNPTSQKQQLIMEAIQRSANLINGAKNPIICAGYGMLSKPEGPALLRELSEKAQIPVTTTLQGLGSFDEHDEKSLHMLGIYGTGYANTAIQEADCVIVLGARLDDRVTVDVARFAPAARRAASQGTGGIIHFELQPKNINKVVKVTEGVEGDVSDNLKLMLPLIKNVSSRCDWMGRIKELKKNFPIDHFDRAPPSGLLNPQTVVEELSKLTEPLKDKVVITTGAGNHQMWVAQHYRWRYPRTMVTPGASGTMGYGLPSAIGVKLAQPEKIVIDIDGDANFQMTLMELKTAALYNIGVKIIIMNNDEQGMVTQWQSLFFEDRFMLAHHGNPDFVKVAEGMGIKAIRISKPDQLEDGLREMLNYDGPVLLDVITDSKTMVYPMVPPGNALHEFMVYDEESEKKRRALMKQRTGY
ncbi:Acetolactate synthase, mitochondrial [Orbilia javanica]|uniref:Acetolactate synthase n=1 Tax=Orbilia javanica TaxID=47235 RepID=A0AAN8N0N9_9PEZI